MREPTVPAATMHPTPSKQESLVGFLRHAPAPQPSSDPVAAAVEDLRRRGADPAKPHETRHFIYAPGVQTAQALARSLVKPDRKVEVDPSGRQGYWMVVVIESMPITSERIGALRSELEAAASAAGAEYDSWQVEVAEG